MIKSTELPKNKATKNDIIKTKESSSSNQAANQNDNQLKTQLMKAFANITNEGLGESVRSETLVALVDGKS